MPKLSQRTEVTTETVVELTPKLTKKVKTKLDILAKLVTERKRIELAIANEKVELETIFHDAGESEAVENGVKVGEITIKVIKSTSRRLDKKRLMKVHGLTPHDLDACSPEKENEPYLGVFGGVFGGKKGGGDE